MNAQKRIQIIRLIDRLKNNPDFAKKIEVDWGIADKQKGTKINQKGVK